MRKQKGMRPKAGGGACANNMRGRKGDRPTDNDRHIRPTRRGSSSRPRRNGRASSNDATSDLLSGATPYARALRPRHSPDQGLPPQRVSTRRRKRPLQLPLPKSVASWPYPKPIERRTKRRDAMSHQNGACWQIKKAGLVKHRPVNFLNCPRFKSRTYCRASAAISHQAANDFFHFTLLAWFPGTYRRFFWSSRSR
jgi:hypothetical protein